MRIEFNEEEGQHFKEIVAFYLEVKKLMINAEEVADESFTPATEEFRYAFDHLMRVFAFKLDLKKLDLKTVKPAEDGYAIKNLKPAFSHLYRAGCDLLGWLSIIFRERVGDELKGFSAGTLHEIFPKYYHEIKPYFEVVAPKEAAKLRDEKDIAKENNKEENNKDFKEYKKVVENFREYNKVVKKLGSYYEEALKIKPSLIEYENKTKNEQRKSRLWQIIIAILVAVVGVIIGSFLT